MQSLKDLRNSVAPKTLVEPKENTAENIYLPAKESDSDESVASEGIIESKTANRRGKK